MAVMIAIAMIMKYDSNRIRFEGAGAEVMGLATYIGVKLPAGYFPSPIRLPFQN